MTAVEQARRGLSGLTVRYEDVTADPETVVRRLCGFLGVAFEPLMLECGRFAHAGFTAGLGDSSKNIRSGRVQPAAPPPGEIPPDVMDLCAAWGYLRPTADQPTARRQAQHPAQERPDNPAEAAVPTTKPDR